jgi:hypothetical protein
MSNLDPDRLLQLYRSAHEPSAVEHERALGVVLRRVDAGDPGLTLLATPTKAAGRSVRLIVLGGVIALAGVGLGYGLGERGRAPSSTTAVAEREAPPAPPQLDAPPAPPAAVVIPSREPSSEEPSVEPPEPAPKRRRRAAPKSAPEPESVPPPPSASTLREEMQLLSKGRKLMRDADPTAALAVFESHGSRFPSGALAEEREVHRHEALCELGRLDQARALRSAFARDYPRSPHAAKLARACKEPEP